MAQGPMAGFSMSLWDNPADMETSKQSDLYKDSWLCSSLYAWASPAARTINRRFASRDDLQQCLGLL
jgi:hypothetical protein